MTLVLRFQAYYHIYIMALYIHTLVRLEIFDCYLDVKFR